jgi:hypothetical protein
MLEFNNECFGVAIFNYQDPLLKFELKRKEMREEIN